jgi:putative ATPase
MPNLFAQSEADNLRAAQPLAARMRPTTLDEFVGQQHVLGEGKLLRRLLAADRLGSVIFYGPPGTGKTTLARLLATASKRKFRQLSAVTSGVKDLREVLDKARDDLAGGGERTLLFIDEIHRFNKAQQDALLPDVEEGIVTLVGATTSNPFFAVISALVSRSQIFEFQPLSADDIKSLLRRALADKTRGLGNYDVRMHEDALDFLAEVSDGDARRALAALEIGVLSSVGSALRGVPPGSPHALQSSRHAPQSSPHRGTHEVGRREEPKKAHASPKPGHISRSEMATVGHISRSEMATVEMATVEFTRELAAESVQRKAGAYDPTGDEHYDAISALIKSVRGSDPDAGMYWLARMLEAGEDIRFLCRRLVILASEDVGNADPQALPLAVATMQACEFVGLPECQLPLAQCVAYLACAPKSNAATMAIGEARKDIREGRVLPVPVHLRDRHYPGAERLGHGAGYEYAHDAEGGIAAQDYLGVEREYYRPVPRGFEAELAERLAAIRARLREK